MVMANNIVVYVGFKNEIDFHFVLIKKVYVVNGLWIKYMNVCLLRYSIGNCWFVQEMFVHLCDI